MLEQINPHTEQQQIEQKVVVKFEANKEEILQVVDVMKKIESFTSLAMEESRDHYEDYDQFMKGKFKELDLLLSSEQCFRYKFSTSSTYSDDTEEPPEYSPETDSLYYVTAGGITVRLKAKNLKYGINDVVQPVTEKSFFTKGDKISEVPTIGDDVCDASSSSFRKVILSGNVETYIPTLELEGGDINSLRRFHFHNGHRINHIFKSV